jgi:elongation factor 2
MMEKLWGDNYFDAEAKKWKSSDVSDAGKPLKRAFCSFIMEPIIRLARSIMEGNVEQMNKMLISIEIELKQEDREL